MFIVINKRMILRFMSNFIIISMIFCGWKLYENKVVSVSNLKDKAYVVIIIDDFGNNAAGTNEMLSLPIEFTGAVMPSMERTEQESELLFKAGKDVILHMPMEPHKGKLSWLGKSYILDSYTDDEVKKVFTDSLEQINHSVGVNNHMGSKVTENERIFNVIFSIIKDKDLIFIDSVTTPNSIVEKVAKEYGIKYLKRDVFLDSTQDISKIKQNLIKTGDIALKNGYAVAIGHVGAEGGIATYKAIKEVYNQMEQKGIEFIGVKKLADYLY